MGYISENYLEVKKTIPDNITLVAISKTHPVEAIMEVYQLGHRVFGESKAQEMLPKYEALPKDIEWHMVGHLQTNKVKYIAPFVSLIHSVDSLKLLKAINKEAKKNNRTIDCLLQMHIASEDTKFGLSMDEAVEILESKEFAQMDAIRLRGLMCMATFTDDEQVVIAEFKKLKSYFEVLKGAYFAKDSSFQIRSMGMSDDYAIALNEGSTMVRVGSSIFGKRDYSK